jgi:hypothetical protein
MSQTRHDDRLKLQFPRIRAQEGTAMAYIIEYLKTHPIEPKFLLQELLYHSFFARAFNALIQPKGDTGNKEHLVQEGWKSIWHHWGTIEAICAACDISPQDVVGRLGGQPPSPPPPASQDKDSWSGLKISDFAAYVEQASANGHDDGSASSADAAAGELSDSDRERMNDISGMFGA